MEPNSTAKTAPRDADSADSTAAGPAAERPRPRTAAEWSGLVLLAAAVLIFGAMVFVLGPLLAIACSDCQDGVRGPLRFGTALMVTDHVGVPLTTLGTLVAMFAVRRGAQAGGIGLGILLLLLLVQWALGQATV
ncbi:hypothetical protein ACFYMO_28310 [Streptomyces sp. NPDC007025]|uniref:hypothetical protein n=1 Tax=Streptomyces sp. NPDC007025 TaxID=3364771 RepID=UPI0036BFE7B3